MNNRGPILWTIFHEQMSKQIVFTHSFGLSKTLAVSRIHKFLSLTSRSRVLSTITTSRTFASTCAYINSIKILKYLKMPLSKARFNLMFTKLLFSPLRRLTPHTVMPYQCIKLTVNHFVNCVTSYNKITGCSCEIVQ